MILRVFHEVSDAARKRAAQQNQDVPRYRFTEFLPPFPGIVEKFMRLDSDGKSAEINLALSYGYEEIGARNGCNEKIVQVEMHVSGFGEIPEQRFRPWKKGNFCTVASTGIDVTIDEVVAALTLCEMTPEMQAASDQQAGFAEAYREKIAQSKALHATEEQERKAREMAAKEKSLSEFRTWASQHGSEKLRARVAGAFEWLPLARREFAVAEIAKIGLRLEEENRSEHDSMRERTTPDIEEMRIIAEVEKNAPATTSARLVRVTYSDDESQTEIEFSVTCPDGGEKKLYFKV